MFGDAGLLLYQSSHIPDKLNIQLWVIESDENIRRFSADVEQITGDDAFKGLVAAVGAAITVTNPILAGVIGMVLSLLRKKFRDNRDGLVGY